MNDYDKYMSHPLIVKAVNLEWQSKWKEAVAAYLECETMNSDLEIIHSWCIDAHYWRKQSEMCARIEDCAWSWSLVPHDNREEDLDNLNQDSFRRELFRLIWGYNIKFITKYAILNMYQGILRYPSISTTKWIDLAKQCHPEFKESNIRLFYNP